MAALGRYLVPPRRREAILAARARTTARITALWDEFDVLLTPGAGQDGDRRRGRIRQPAPVAIDIAGRFTPFTPMFNITGQPAISIPAGVGSDGLPLAVQLVGRVGAEDTLYSLAGQIEAAAPWAQRRPTCHEPPLRLSLALAALAVGVPRGCRRGLGPDGVAVQAGTVTGPLQRQPGHDGVLADAAQAQGHPPGEGQGTVDRLLLRVSDRL